MKQLYECPVCPPGGDLWRRISVDDQGRQTTTATKGTMNVDSREITRGCDTKEISLGLSPNSLFI